MATSNHTRFSEESHAHQCWFHWCSLFTVCNWLLSLTVHFFFSWLYFGWVFLLDGGLFLYYKANIREVFSFFSSFTASHSLHRPKIFLMLICLTLVSMHIFFLNVSVLLSFYMPFPFSRVAALSMHQLYKQVAMSQIFSLHRGVIFGV